MWGVVRERWNHFIQQVRIAIQPFCSCMVSPSDIGAGGGGGGECPLPHCPDIDLDRSICDDGGGSGGGGGGSDKWCGTHSPSSQH